MSKRTIERSYIVAKSEIENAVTLIKKLRSIQSERAHLSDCALLAYQQAKESLGVVRSLHYGGYELIKEMLESKFESDTNSIAERLGLDSTDSWDKTLNQTMREAE